VDAVVLVVHQQLRKHHTPLRVHRTVGDPVLVAQRGGTAARQTVHNSKQGVQQPCSDGMWLFAC
jgi:hypothetical protein